MTRLTLMGLGFMREQLRQLQRAGYPIAADFSGVIALARDAPHAARQAQIAEELNLAEAVAAWRSTEQVTQQAGVILSQPGWWFAGAGWVSPLDWLRAVQQAGAISVQYQAEITRLYQEDGLWIGEDAQGLRIFTSDQVVLANAEQAARLLPDLATGLVVCRGQVSWVQRTELKQTESQQFIAQPALPFPLMREGYALDVPCAQSSGGLRLFGASFKPDDVSLAVRITEQQENADRLAAISPMLALSSSELKAASARASLRVTTHDRLPLAGAWAMPGYEGVWLNVGHGSRGLSWGALLAEALAAQMTGEPNVLPMALVQALAPNRLLGRSA